MASIKVLLLKHKPNAQNEYPIAVRVIQNRRPRYISLGHHSKKNDWDERAEQVKSTHPLYKTLKVLIATKKAEVEKMLMDMEIKQPVFSADQLKEKIKKPSSPVTFLRYAESYVQEIFNRGKINVAKSERSRLAGFKKFLKAKNPEIFEVDVPLITRFINQLRSEGKSEKTINNYLIMLRSIYNKAIKDQLVDRAYYPFGGRDKIQLKKVDGSKIGLEQEELERFRNIQGLEEESFLWHTKNVYLLSYNFAGMRIRDLIFLRWSEVQNHRLIYTMGKTQALLSIPLSKEAEEILALYKKGKRGGNDFIFPFLKEADWEDPFDVERKANTAISAFNKKLKVLAHRAGIEKNMSNHIARHTFGNISGDKIPLPILQKLYRHQSLNTTAIYQGNFLHKDTDEAVLRLLNK